jgi:hypothetical protein
METGTPIGPTSASNRGHPVAGPAVVEPEPGLLDSTGWQGTSWWAFGLASRVTLRRMDQRILTASVLGAAGESGSDLGGPWLRTGRLRSRFQFFRLLARIFPRNGRSAADLPRRRGRAAVRFFLQPPFWPVAFPAGLPASWASGVALRGFLPRPRRLKPPSIVVYGRLARPLGEPAFFFPSSCLPLVSDPPSSQRTVVLRVGK